jgi:hypothetical protein
MMANTVTREEFAKALLVQLKLEPTKRRLWALVSWMQAEGGNARFNPLNTTHEMPKATIYNEVGVKNYDSLHEGVMATAKTLDYGARNNLYGYKAIRTALVKNKWASKTLWAVEHSQWGTGGLALKCLPGVKREWDKYRQMPIAS